MYVRAHAKTLDKKDRWGNMPVFGVKTEVIETFGEVLDHFRLKAQEGVESMAEAVLRTSKASMEYGGEPEWRTKEGYDEGREEKTRREGKPWYKAAPPKKPPYYHTKGFMNAMKIFGVGEFRVVGFKDPEMALRAAWFEFGGRPLEIDPETGEMQKGKPRKREYHLHKFLGPALDDVLDEKGGKGFEYRVAEAMNMG